ncbi:unnamed protein product [Discosporangium mesarthrocarpum]
MLLCGSIRGLRSIRGISSTRGRLYTPWALVGAVCAAHFQQEPSSCLTKEGVDDRRPAKGSATVVVVVEIPRGAVLEGPVRGERLAFPCAYGKALGLAQDDGGSVDALLISGRPLEPTAAIRMRVVSSVTLGYPPPYGRQVTLLVSDEVTKEGEALSIEDDNAQDSVFGLPPEVTQEEELTDFFVKFKKMQTNLISCLMGNWTSPPETVEVLHHLRDNYATSPQAQDGGGEAPGSQGGNEAQSGVGGSSEPEEAVDPGALGLRNIPLTELLRELVKRGEAGEDGTHEGTH